METSKDAPAASAKSPTAGPVTRHVPVSQFKPSPHQARKDFAEDTLLLLSQSMKREGLIQPITARLLPDGTMELVAGERRLRAAKMLGWETIETRVLEGISDQDAAVKGLIENLLRKDLNPIEQANGFKQLTEAPFNLSHEAIGQKVGKDQSTITRILGLLELPEDIQNFMSRDMISERHVRSVKPLGDKDRQNTLLRQAAKEGWGVRETENRVNKVLGKVASPPAPLPKGEGGADAKRSATGEATTPDPWAYLKAQQNKDPYVSAWPALLENVCVSGINGDWSVKFESGSWHFQVRSSHIQTQKDLGQWFLDMAKGLGAAPAAAPAVTAAPTVPADPASQKEAIDPKVQAMIDRVKARRGIQ